MINEIRGTIDYAEFGEGPTVVFVPGSLGADALEANTDPYWRLFSLRDDEPPGIWRHERAALARERQHGL